MARAASGTGALALNAPRSGPGFSQGATQRKPILHFDREIISERFKAGRPNGVAYKNPSREFAEANHHLAQQAVEDIVDVLQSRIRATGRPQRETRYLVTALRDPQNYDFNASGFTVGIDSYLERSRAGRYFRNLEYGSRVFVGRVLEGFFEGAGGKKLDPRPGAKDALRLRQTGNFTNPSDQPSGRFSESLGPSRSSRTAGEFEVANAPGRSNYSYRGGTHHRSGPIVIKNPIPSYFYFRDGIRRFRQRAEGPGGLIAQEYARAAEQFVGRGGLIIH